jgi:hypothetical protein
MSQPITIGRIVHYVVPEGRYKGQVRPAICVSTSSATTANFQVFTDGSNDNDWLLSGEQETLPDAPKPKRADRVVWRTSVGYDEAGAPGTWHWPPRG